MAGVLETIFITLMDQSKILVTVCETENSGNGLKYAINLAKTKNAELDIVHVLKTEEPKKEMPHAEIIKKELSNGLPHKEIIRKGEIATEILKITAELEPEIIIMSPDIFNKGKKFFEESETGKVIKRSGAPILMVPPDTEFKGIRNIILGTNMRENIIEPANELLKIFKNLSPHINILVFTDKTTEWHFKEDVSNLVNNIKDYTQYKNISGNICDHSDICMGLELYSQKVHADLICMSYDVDIFYNLFFSCKTSTQIASLINKPFLILTRYGGDPIKTS